MKKVDLNKIKTTKEYLEEIDFPGSVESYDDIEKRFKKELEK